MSILEKKSAVTVELDALTQGSIPFTTLEEAFGPESLGIIVVKGLPERFQSLRLRLLSYSSYLANLPEQSLKQLESPDSHYLVGWSLGKEKLKDGAYDTFKGSYYVNCAPSFSQGDTQTSLATRYPTFPEYTAPNVWPSEDTLPGFRESFEELCTLIIDVAVLVARACDRYAEKNIDGYKPGYLEHVVNSSVSTKARLLHYFPPPSADNNKSADEDDWCATHVDHGCLTGLTSAMFIDEDASVPTLLRGLSELNDRSHVPKDLTELAQSPDPQAGLYIHSRSGAVTKVAIPRDCLAFQTGEALEIITKGKFKAVPHFVRGAKATKHTGRVARNTLAVFTQPNLWEMIDEKRSFAEFAREIVERNH
ncbi:Clavaminate synthase-like protein [Pseudovirgaria hyperparasitica]|uniref:Clavaminate synthase-like protein n=1 Tax=Pseudovirgaria hyperparasitica TaxID=470096 RepID=A0A6A6WBZ4_9PEZI|nr:Clavaminate synthase-like protein [Pseudovirgaria hyperparasitica]KAF2758631.1 Clavaminate synthase-like protein [Pseudovirgaria hyperparasitica]